MPFVAFQEAAVSGWRKYGLRPATHIVDWHNESTDFPEKLARLVGRIARFLVT
jgi:hypothetical protein